MAKFSVVQIVSIFFFSASVYAAPSKSALWNKVDVGLDDHGNIQSLTIKNPTAQYSFSKYVRDFVGQAQAMKNELGFQHSVAELNIGLSPENQKSLKAQALQALSTVDFDLIENDPGFKAVIGKLGQRLDRTFLEQNVIAEFDDPTFFFAATWRKDLVEWALDVIESAGLSDPAVNLAVYLFQRAVDDLVERRAFYQSYTLHYVLTSTPADLGLTEDETNLILSSLYESRIKFYDLIQSHQAQSDWADFGQTATGKDSADCAQRLAKSAGNYDSLGSPFDFIFSPAQFLGRPVVVNFRDTFIFGSDSPSLAFDENNPQSIRNSRIAYEVFLLGINVAPIPGAVQAVVTWLMQTQFVPQIGTEGDLMAYYEAAGDTVRMKTVIEQSVNPWLLADDVP